MSKSIHWLVAMNRELETKIINVMSQIENIRDSSNKSHTIACSLLDEFVSMRELATTINNEAKTVKVMGTNKVLDILMSHTDTVTLIETVSKSLYDMTIDSLPCVWLILNRMRGDTEIGLDEAYEENEIETINDKEIRPINNDPEVLEIINNLRVIADSTINDTNFIDTTVKKLINDLEDSCVLYNSIEDEDRNIIAKYIDRNEEHAVDRQTRHYIINVCYSIIHNIDIYSMKVSKVVSILRIVLQLCDKKTISSKNILKLQTEILKLNNIDYD